MGGAAAVAALVDGGVDAEVSPLCSGLSLTGCFLGNRGALAIAKACCRLAIAKACCQRRNLEELCLENCGIGNAGATVLALALEEGTTMRHPPTAGDIWIIFQVGLQERFNPAL